MEYKQFIIKMAKMDLEFLDKPTICGEMRSLSTILVLRGRYTRSCIIAGTFHKGLLFDQYVQLPSSVSLGLACDRLESI